MKKTRWAVLALLVAAVAVVVAGFHASRRRNLLEATAPPARLPAELNSLANNWSWSQSSRDRPVVEARARSFRQIKDSTRFEVGDLELRIFSRSGLTYDLVRSRQGEFDQAAEKLTTPGEATIVLGLPAPGREANGRQPVRIRTSGLSFESRTGLCSTDRPVEFSFPDGKGRSVGALYDSAARYLLLKGEVELTGERMRIRAGELHYREAEQKIELRPWSRLERGSQGVEAAAAVVFLDQGDLKRVEAQQGKGFDSSAGRDLRFSAEQLEVDFTPQGGITQAKGMGSASVVSRSPAGLTRLTGGRVDLEFTTPPGAVESELAVAWAREQARIENVPAPAGAPAPPETRVLTAEMVKLVMASGGRDLRSIETLTPARLEFLPNHASQWKRLLNAQRLSVQYLSGNRLERLHATGQVHLRNEPPAGAASSPPRLTWSDDLEAFFDPETGQMRELRQWSNFRFQEGPQQARSGGARFDLAANRITLDTAARVWDETSSTTGDFLFLDQKEDFFRAEGKVTSIHRDKPHPGRPAAAAPEALFSTDRPLYATAARLESRDGSRRLEYSGSARLWQEGNSIRADRLRLDRDGRVLSAQGNVESLLVEQGPSRRLLRVTADALLYTDQNRRALYTGNVALRREGMTVKAPQLEAFLRPEKSTGPGESRLERALASGGVEILETPAAGRPLLSRRATAENAEYVSGEERVVLRGGRPAIEQPGRGSTQGEELTYYLGDDRLLVKGQPGARSRTRQRLKPN